jgi:predicted DNA-binding protein
MSKSLDKILDKFEIEPEPAKSETTFSVWVDTDLKERHKRLPRRVRKKVAETLREVIEVVITKAEQKAS